MLWSVVLAVTFTCCVWKTSKYSLKCLVRGAVNIALLIFPLSAVGLEVLLNPRHCICPNQNYTCDVKSGIGLAWLTNTTSPDDLEHSTSETDDEQYIERGGFQVAFQRIESNEYNSTLHVRDLGLNQTILTCEGSTIVDLSTLETIMKTDTTSICVSGNISISSLSQNLLLTPQDDSQGQFVCLSKIWCELDHEHGRYGKKSISPILPVVVVVLIL